MTISRWAGQERRNRIPPLLVAEKVQLLTVPLILHLSCQLYSVVQLVHHFYLKTNCVIACQECLLTETSKVSLNVNSSLSTETGPDSDRNSVKCGELLS